MTSNTDLSIFSQLAPSNELVLIVHNITRPVIFNLPKLMHGGAFASYIFRLQLEAEHRCLSRQAVELQPLHPLPTLGAPTFSVPSTSVHTADACIYSHDHVPACCVATTTPPFHRQHPGLGPHSPDLHPQMHRLRRMHI